MSFRHSGSKTFKASEFIATECGYALGPKCPEICPVHAPYCIRVPAPFGTTSFGVMKLASLMNVKAVMPGAKQKLLTLTVDSMIDNFWGWYDAKAEIRLVADNAEIFKRDIYHSGDMWRVNELVLDIDISKVNNLDIQLKIGAIGYTGYATLHCTVIKLDWEWYSEIPPITATTKVTVKDSKTGALIRKAHVALMSGVRVIADDYTDGGVVIFENIDEGSYTIKVSADGYNDFEQSIEVKAPLVWYTVKIVPIPVTPTPDWVWWAVGGVAAFSAIVTLPRLIGRKPEEKVIVVR